MNVHQILWPYHRHQSRSSWTAACSGRESRRRGLQVELRFPESVVEAQLATGRVNYGNQEPLVETRVPTNHDAIASIRNCSYNNHIFAIGLTDKFAFSIRAANQSAKRTALI